MVELEVWYDQEPEDDFGAGGQAIVVRTGADLNGLIDRVLAETAGHRCPAAIQVNLAGRRMPGMEVGLGREKGFILYHAEDAGTTVGDGVGEDVEYVYQGNVIEVPAGVEVPVAEVRAGLHEFLATGGRPAVVRVR